MYEGIKDSLQGQKCIGKTGYEINHILKTNNRLLFYTVLFYYPTITTCIYVTQILMYSWATFLTGQIPCPISSSSKKSQDRCPISVYDNIKFNLILHLKLNLI